MLDGWRTAQSSILSLIPETSVAAGTPPLVFVTMATGIKRTSAMTLFVSRPSSMVRIRELCRLMPAVLFMCVSEDQNSSYTTRHLNADIQPSKEHLTVAHDFKRRDINRAGLLWYCIGRGRIIRVGPWGNEAHVSNLCLWSHRPKAIGFRSSCVDSALLGPQCPLGAEQWLSSESSLIYITFPQSLWMSPSHMSPPGSWAQTNFGKWEAGLFFVAWNVCLI